MTNPAVAAIIEALRQEDPFEETLEERAERILEAIPPQRQLLFADVTTITAWLDRSNPPSLHEDAMRVFKLMEEMGEVAEAYIGMVGQNPRKGVTHTLHDVLRELADVVVTALCAIQHFTQEEAVTAGIVYAKLSAVKARAGLG